MGFYDYDYEGDMDVFVRKLERAGITAEKFDITNYVGLTYRELVSLTDRVIAAMGKKDKEETA